VSRCGTKAVCWPFLPNMSDARAWPPSASLAALRLRARVYRRIRGFFEARDVLEVETPILSAAANCDPNIRSFETRYSGPAAGGRARRFLRTSPEFSLKRLLAAGIGDCYELGRVFRDGEAGRNHNPEFTMLEWYRLGWDHLRLAGEVVDLVQCCRAEVDASPATVRRISYRELFAEAFGFDAFTAAIEALRVPLADFSIEPDGLLRDDWLDLLISLRLQPTWPADQLLLLYDFPPSQCALARIRGSAADAVAERFEVYLGAQELANGYHELADATEQRERFERELERRRQRGDQAVLPVDLALLEALEAGFPDCAGVALGIDRLLMQLAGLHSIHDVQAFPFERA
jgi:lysyl-tRNA synthetase class 2